MARRTAGWCSICESDEADDINAELVQGYPVNAVAMAYNVPRRTMIRHYKDHVARADGQGLSLINIEDIINIPMQMKERRHLMDAMLVRLLEPLMGKGKGQGISNTQMGYVIRILRLQQHDETTLLKITGLMPAEGGAVETSRAGQYTALRGNIEARLEEYTKGDPEATQRIKLLLADILMPIEGLGDEDPHNPFSYQDLGAITEDD